MRELAGEPSVVVSSVQGDGEGAKEEKRVVGRPLPKFEKEWRAAFDAGHLLRIRMWQRLNEEAERKLVKEREGKLTNGNGHVDGKVNGDVNGKVDGKVNGDTNGWKGEKEKEVRQSAML